MRQWFVLRSKPNKEALLHKQMEAYGVEAFLPQLTVNPVNPRARKARPYFTGYLFVNLDLQATGYSFLQWMPYSLGLVNFGGEVAFVSDELIRTIKKQVAESVMRNSVPFANKHGDLVTIERGPFAGYKAMFDTNLSGTERARVLLLLLQNRQLAIDMPINFLRTHQRA
jgi:transcription antitermination factor NusG